MQDGPKQKQKVVKKIPAKVIQNAKGLAIFTTMRTGLWMSGAGGSGILVGRKDDGTWSPPSGIMLHTAGLGFLVGVDIYDCVVVINTVEALEAFTKIRCTLGSEISVVAGPVGVGGILESELHKRQAPIFTYMKSRGFYAGVQIDGTVIIERSDENERFYGERLPVKDILAGKVRHPPYELRRLMETIKAAQGDTFDAGAIPLEPPPSDYVLDDGHHFGIPEKDDPDPYGVLALEKEGLGLKEAGTQKRASWEAFKFAPSPTSPIHAVYSRDGSQDRQSSKHSSWRTSAFAGEVKSPSSLRNSFDLGRPRRPTLMTDTSTQTDFPTASSSTRSGESPSRGGAESVVSQDSSKDTSKDTSKRSNANGYTTPPHTPPIITDSTHSPEDDDDDHFEDAHIEEPVVHSVQTVQAIQPTSPTAISKARLVTVPKRVAPKLPPRNPNRSGPLIIDASPVTTETTEQLDTPTAVSPIATTLGPSSPTKTSPVTVRSTSPDPSPSPATETRKDQGIEDLKAGMDDIKLDDEEDEAMPNPWAKIEEDRKRRSLETSSPMPGGFE